MSNPDRKILVLWVIAVALITRDEIRSGYTLPRPHRYTGSAIVYGMAALLAELAGPVAVVFALGWTIAIALRRGDATAEGTAPAEGR